MTKKPIVLGIEGNQPTALQFAVDAAATRRTGIRVVHCVEPLITGDLIAAPDGSWQAADSAWREAGQAVLDEAKTFLDSTDTTADTEFVLTFAAPSSTLQDEAESAEMVVVGSDAASWTDRFFGGHVTAHLAKHAPAPVAIVPERSWTTPLTGGVFIALDGRTLATGPLTFAFDEASRRGNDLHVIHAIPTATPADELTRAREDIAEVLAGWADKYPDVQVTRRIAFDEADEACLRASEEAELLVLGRAPKPVFELPWGHPVLTAVARRAHCPCVVVPDTWKDA